MSNQSLSRYSITLIVAKIHWLGREWVGGIAPPLWQTIVLLSASVEPSTEIGHTHIRVLLQLDDATFHAAVPVVLGVASLQTSAWPGL